MPLIPQEAEAGGISEFKANLVYRVSSRTARAEQRTLVSTIPPKASSRLEGNPPVCICRVLVKLLQLSKQMAKM